MSKSNKSIKYKVTATCHLREQPAERAIFYNIFVIMSYDGTG